MDNKSIGIVTLFGYFNYGNRLQNYAVQEIMKKYGFHPETIVVYPNRKQQIKTIVCQIKSFLGNTSAKRYMKLYYFSKKYIPVRVIVSKNMKIPHEFVGKYAYFVTGSDQVWNPLIRPKERDNFFLRFADKNQRLCISPSFGVSEIDDQYQKNFIDGLNGFQYLCTREKAGVDIIHTLTGREAELLIDPTLALKSEQWKQIAVVPKQKSKSYILLAMLGNLSEIKKNYIYRIAENHHLQIVNIFGEKSAYAPDEVIGLIDSAKLVFTDSFHFTAFSINFNIPFVVTKREDNVVNSSMFSRITSLLSMFGMEKRAYENITEQELFPCDFSYANKVLEEERKKFYQYVEKCIGLNKE